MGCDDGRVFQDDKRFVVGIQAPARFSDGALIYHGRIARTYQLV